MEANVGSAGLPSTREDEVVAVGRQMADAVESRGRTMRERRRPVRGAALPAWALRGELKPGSAKLLVLRTRRAREPVDTMRHAVKGTAAASRVLVASDTPLASA